MFARAAGHADIVAVLLARGANPNVATKVGETPEFIRPNSVPGFGLAWESFEAAYRPIGDGASPTPGGMTPLLYAARHSHLEVAKRLIAAGADVERQEADGIWPLLMAISNNNVAVARYLLEHGSNVNGQDWYGRSPLWEAVNVRNLYVHNATFKNGIDRGPVLELIRGPARCRRGCKCPHPGNSAVSPLSPGDHRLTGVGGLHRTDAISHGGARG